MRNAYVGLRLFRVCAIPTMRNLDLETVVIRTDGKTSKRILEAVKSRFCKGKVNHGWRTPSTGMTGF